MMLRGNLATRPFYNERLVGLLLAVLGVVVVGLTVSNAMQLLQLSGRRSELQAQISADEAEAARMREGAVAIQRGVDRAALASLAGSTREANQLIDARTFSWTTFFSYIESTIPTGVRLLSVVPEFKKGDINITLRIIGRQVEDVTKFMKDLEGTGAFFDVGPTTAEPTEEDFERITIKARYLPPPAAKTAKPGEGDVR